MTCTLIVGMAPAGADRIGCSPILKDEKAVKIRGHAVGGVAPSLLASSRSTDRNPLA